MLVESLACGDRGTGRTTKQMQLAPKGAVFVWVNACLSYQKHLASLLKRQDLLIVSPSWLEYPGGYLGKRLPGIVLDHAADLTAEQWRGWEEAKAMVGRYTILDATQENLRREEN